MTLGVRFHGEGHEEAVRAGQTGRETPPPWSLCPRCKKPVWAQEGTTDLRETQQLLKRNPLPRWCRVCGQRFEYTMGDHISCSSEFSIAETMDTLKSMFPTEQPNFETIAIEAAHEDGEQNG